MDVKKLIDYDTFSDFVIEDHLEALLTQNKRAPGNGRGTDGNFLSQEGLVECRKKLREPEMDLYPEGGYSDEFPRCICKPSQFLRMDY